MKRFIGYTYKTIARAIHSSMDFSYARAVNPHNPDTWLYYYRGKLITNNHKDIINSLYI